MMGEVYCFTVLHVNLDDSAKSEPEIVAFVRMGDGGLVHRLGNVSIADVSIGMRVQAVLKSRTERQGSILDILFFEPAEA